MRTRAFWAAAAAALGLTLAVTLPADAATSTTYVVARTFGPYNGAAGPNDPGTVPTGEARSIACLRGESILKGAARVNRTTSYGTTSSNVLTVDVIGAYWDTEDASLKWGAFINATGRGGWNSVTLTVTCRR